MVNRETHALETWPFTLSRDISVVAYTQVEHLSPEYPTVLSTDTSPGWKIPHLIPCAGLQSKHWHETAPQKQI